MGTEWAIVAAGVVVLVAAVLGYLAARPSVTLEANERKRAEERADQLARALDETARAARDRRTGAQADADHDAALRDELAAAPPGDPLAAALGVLRLAARREAARTAAREAGGHAGTLGAGAGAAGPVGDGLAADRPGGLPGPGARA